MRAAAIKETAAVAFVDIAGFSAITDVFGDEIAIDLIERFEALVADSLSGHALPINPHSPSKSLILLSGSQYFRYKSWC